jgi:hypothetical protein
MKLVFLHGSPAVGAPAVAKALLSMVRAVVDNHAAIDLARTVFDWRRDSGNWYMASGARPLTQPQSTAFRLSLQPSAEADDLTQYQESKKSCSDTTVNCFRCSCIVEEEAGTQVRIRSS